MESEFSRIIDLRQISDEPLILEPTETERKRLAARFQLSGVNAMQATISLRREGDSVEAKGHLKASIVQLCAISGEDFPVTISEPIALRFVPFIGERGPDEEIEITADDCDEIEFDGSSFDLGEAVAQSLALAIDPFAEGPNADKARAEHNLGGDVATGPFAVLAALKKD